MKLANVVIVGRLRKDAALRDLPPKPQEGVKVVVGAARKYGKNRISLAKRAGQQRGWQTIACTVYGEVTVQDLQDVSGHLRSDGRVIRVVLVKEDHGWYAFFCTKTAAGVEEILEAFADRATIEQDFHDVKEVWGSGQQQVRNIWTNVAVYNLNLWMHTLVELWAWDKTERQLVDRGDSPWDEAARRPSHANRRKALRQQIMRNELLTITAKWLLPRKIIQLTKSLMVLAT